MSVDPPGIRAWSRPFTASDRLRLRDRPSPSAPSNTSCGRLTTWVKKRSSIRSRGAVVGTIAPSAARTRSQRTPPMLPEPSVTDGTGLVVTVVGRNRPGVLAEITAALASHECDVADISQRNVGGYFHTVFTCAVPPGRDFGSVKDSLQCLGGVGDYAVRVMHESVFRFMHRV